MQFRDTEFNTIVPTKIVGPISITFNNIKEDVFSPVATFETPLWYSIKRGALVSQKADGINVYVQDDGMTRSVIFYTENLHKALYCQQWIEQNNLKISEVISLSSRYAKLKKLTTEVVGNLVFLRLNIFVGNASGHNMVTKAADAVIKLIKEQCFVSYSSISGNICADKKNSAINGLLGRGKRCIAEIFVPEKICNTILRTTSKKIVDLNIHKNLLGSILAGSVRSANAHFANILLAMYLATGQDVANIVEGSQGITFAELREDGLYFSVNIPNMIVGTVGVGKEQNFVKRNLQIMKCDGNSETESCRLSAIICATVLCSELSLLAAQTNEGELMQAHIKFERNKLCM